MEREETRIEMSNHKIIESKTLFIYNIVSLIIVISTIAMGVAYIQKDTEKNSGDIRRIELIQKESMIHNDIHEERQQRDFKELEERLRSYSYQRAQDNKRAIESLKTATQSNKESLIIYSTKIDSIESNIEKIAKLLEKLENK